MDVSPFFQIVRDYAVFRPVGRVSQGQTAEMVRLSIELAKRERVGNLLAVLTRLDGIPSPSLARRFNAISEWAFTSLGRVRVSLVVHPWLLDPQKFGSLVGRNRGLINDAFASEEEALDWLLTYRPGSVEYPWEVPVKELPLG
jgi:hypothetical protein